MLGIQKSGGQSLTSPRYDASRYKDQKTVSRGSPKDVTLCVSRPTAIFTRGTVDKREDESLRIVDKRVLVARREVVGSAGAAEE